MNFPLYEEKQNTIRVHGGSGYFELFIKIKEKLTQFGSVDLAYMGSPSAWQTCQSLCVLCTSFDADIRFTKYDFKTPDGNRIGVVTSITLKKEAPSDEVTNT